ncbi:MAG: hypothetical protein NT178_03615 [Proteobacteria bacterium]|nr:hypothetical protein [Pseudomonadota bacterium]
MLADPLTGITYVTLMGLMLTLIMGVMSITLQRQYAIIPFLFITLFVSGGQRIVIGDFNFILYRIATFFAWVGVMRRHDLQFITLNRIDKVFIYFVIAAFFSRVLLFGSWASVVNRLGFAYDMIGMYFLFRCLITDMEDVVRVIKIFTYFAVGVAAIMIFESLTGQKFTFFGGLQQVVEVRETKVRAQGPFGHSILAGTFGAVLVPMAISLWKEERGGKKIAIICFFASTIIVMTSGSSGPVMSYVAGLFGIFMWRFKNNARFIWRVTLVTMVFLQIGLSWNVWRLLAKFKIYTASTAYHRYKLLDAFFEQFGDWWLFGSASTAYWDEYGKLADVTNWFVRIGVNGGLFTLILFIYIFVLCFNGLGKLLRASEGEPGKQFFLWGIGASLFTHVVSSFGVAYFDQNVSIFLTAIAMISLIISLPQNVAKEEESLDSKGQFVYLSAK